MKSSWRGGWVREMIHDPLHPPPSLSQSHSSSLSRGPGFQWPMGWAESNIWKDILPDSPKPVGLGGWTDPLPSGWYIIEDTGSKSSGTQRAHTSMDVSSCGLKAALFRF